MADLVLAEADWTVREHTHRHRARRFLQVYRSNPAEGHPVWDFLFTYYRLRPGHLRRWHPGYGVVLAGAAARRYLSFPGYGAHPGGVAVTRDHVRTRADTVRFVSRLLAITAAHPTRLNCFGLHEWAMLYKSATARHASVPLRLGAAGTDAVVELIPLRCSHFDAFRFFTAPAARRNLGTPTRAGQSSWEQPGCLHANMDLCKWCYKLAPLVDSEVLMDCLELAAHARAVDMRASPYDLSGYGFAPIAIETPAGRTEYVRAQQDIARRAAVLRAAVRTRCDQLLTALS